MMLSNAGLALSGPAPSLLVALSAAGYLLAALPVRPGQAPFFALLVGWVLHLALLVLDISGMGQDLPGARIGFATVLSSTVWLVVAVHAIESRFVPLPAVRRILAPMGAIVVLLVGLFPGEPRQYASALAPLHFVLGVGSYGLFGAAVLHAALLDAAERRMRRRSVVAPVPLAANGRLGAAPRPLPAGAFGMPLLQLERLTFRFVEAGFVVLTATLLLGVLTTAAWHWDHKTVFSLLGWAVFAALLLGRRYRGWRGHLATRWLYAGALLLLLAYVGSRFVVEVLLPVAAP